MIKLAIITHDEEYSQRLTNRLSGEKDINLLSTMISINLKNEVKQVIAFAKQMILQRPDILLIDQVILRDAVAINMQQVLTWRDKLKTMKVIVIGERFNEENVMTMIQEGARGFFLTPQDDEQLLKCIRVISRGEFWLGAELNTRFLEKFIETNKKNKDRLEYLSHLSVAKLEMLSRREMEVLELISQSMTNEEIAEKLCLSLMTVKTHMRHIFKKAEIRNRVEAALVYARHALMSQ